MKRLLFLFFVSTSLLFNSSASEKKYEGYKTNSTIVSVILIVQPGDGYFKITRRLFKALHLSEDELTWQHVQYIQSLYQEKYQTSDLIVGNEITILKTEFLK